MNQGTQQQFFQEIIEQHKGILLRIARVYCSNEEDRQDLLQEMMIQIWRSLHKYNDQFKMSTFLYRISLNVAISYYRRNKTRTDQQEILNEQTLQIPADDSSGNEQQLKLLQQFISELKEIDKALMLLYLEDKTYADIAEILGITISNVGTKVGRIKANLKTQFSQLK